jgi:hypothetical protein
MLEVLGGSLPVVRLDSYASWSRPTTKTVTTARDKFRSSFPCELPTEAIRAAEPSQRESANWSPGNPELA